MVVVGCVAGRAGGRAGGRGKGGVGVGCVGMGGVYGREAGGGGREEWEREGRGQLTARNTRTHTSNPFSLTLIKSTPPWNANARLWWWHFTDVTDSTVTSGRRCDLGPAPSLTSDEFPCKLPQLHMKNDSICHHFRLSNSR